MKGREFNDAYVVAHLYYERKLIQEEISRPKVARLLARAHEDGIVRITVREPGRRSPELEAALVEGFGLRAAEAA